MTQQRQRRLIGRILGSLAAIYLTYVLASTLFWWLGPILQFRAMERLAQDGLGERQNQFLPVHNQAEFYALKDQLRCVNAVCFSQNFLVRRPLDLSSVRRIEVDLRKLETEKVVRWRVTRRIVYDHLDQAHGSWDPPPEWGEELTDLGPN